MLPLVALVASVALAETPPVDPVTIKLPPFMVEDSAHRPQWHEVELPGLEVLSTCSRPITEHFADNFFRIEQVLQEILPAGLRWQPAIPTAVILVNENDAVISKELTARLTTGERLRALRNTIGKELETSLAKTRKGLFPGRVSAPDQKTYGFIPNLRLADADSAMFFVIVNADFDPAGLSLSDEHLRSLLERRAPPLPAWFIDGFMEVCSSGVLNANGLSLPLFTWLSPEETARLLDQSPGEVVRPDLLSPEALFGHTPPRGMSVQDFRRVQRNQMALFIRWAMTSAGGRSALAKLVEASTDAPVTEKLFDRCFGTDSFRLLEQRLTLFLKNTAVRHSQVIRPAKPIEPPWFTWHTAPEADISRIVGDWEHRAARYVATDFPEIAPHYAEQAHRSFTRAYQQGSRDPRLLAAMGISTTEAGHDAEALPLLEAAAAAGVTRPRVHVELARIRLAQALAAARERDGRLTEKELDAVLTPLGTARTLRPPVRDAYELTLAAWAISPADLPREQVAVLEEGIRYFPDPVLIQRVVALFARHGYHREADRAVAHIRNDRAPADSSFQRKAQPDDNGR